MRTDSPRARRAARSWQIALLCALALLVGAALAACGGTKSLTASSRPSDPSVTDAPAGVSSTPTTATVSQTVSTPASTKATVRTGNAVSSVAPTSSAEGFLGIATELGTINRLAGSSTSDLDTPFIQLLRNLSPGAPILLRLGGDSTDWDWWAVPGMKQPAAIRYTMTPQWAAIVKALLTDADAKAMFGVNLELDNEKVAAYEVKQYEKYIGAQNIFGFELGNEPELYAAFNYYHLKNGTGVRGRVFGHYTLLDYAKDFTKLSAAIPTSDTLIGPSSGSATWLPDLGEMLSNMPKRLKLVTVHAYPLKNCSASAKVSVNDFFTEASIQGLAGSIHSMVLAARAHGKPLRLAETNGVTCGGKAGVSNSFAEALWALNMLPAMWQAGVSGVNIQDIDGNLNQMITVNEPSPGNWSAQVQPVYYGLLAFANSVPAGSHLLSVSDPGYSGFYQYAVKDPNGEHKVVLTNVSSSARTVGVSVSGGHGPGTVSLLTASSLKATSGETLGGQQLDPGTGQLSGSASATAVTSNAKGVYAVKVPAHSAAILTVGS